MIELQKYRKYITFFICFTIALFFWTTTKLSQNISKEIRFEIRYQNVPDYIYLTKENPRFITFNFQNTGFKIWQQSKEDNVLVINLRKHIQKEGTNFSIPLKDVIKEQEHSFILQPKGVKNTLRLYTEKKASKNLAIKLNHSLDFQKGFRLNHIKKSSDSVKVYGKPLDLMELNQVETKLLKIKNIQNDIASKVKLKHIKNVNFSFKEIEVQINTAKFISQEVKYKIHLSEGVVAIPSEVSIRFNQDFDNFKKLSATDFEISIEPSKDEKHILRMKNPNSKIHNLSIYPSEIKILNIK